MKPRWVSYVAVELNHRKNSLATLVSCDISLVGDEGRDIVP
jgi:hypothetical protein